MGDFIPETTLHLPSSAKLLSAAAIASFDDPPQRSRPASAKLQRSTVSKAGSYVRPSSASLRSRPGSATGFNATSDSYTYNEGDSRTSLVFQDFDSAARGKQLPEGGGAVQMPFYEGEMQRFAEYDDASSDDADGQTQRTKNRKRAVRKGKPKKKRKVQRKRVISKTKSAVSLHRRPAEEFSSGVLNLSLPVSTSDQDINDYTSSASSGSSTFSDSDPESNSLNSPPPRSSRSRPGSAMRFLGEQEMIHEDPDEPDTYAERFVADSPRGWERGKSAMQELLQRESSTQSNPVLAKKGSIKDFYDNFTHTELNKTNSHFTINPAINIPPPASESFFSSSAADFDRASREREQKVMQNTDTSRDYAGRYMHQAPNVERAFRFDEVADPASSALNQQWNAGDQVDNISTYQGREFVLVTAPIEGSWEELKSPKGEPIHFVQDKPFKIAAAIADEVKPREYPPDLNTITAVQRLISSHETKLASFKDSNLNRRQKQESRIPKKQKAPWGRIVPPSTVDNWISAPNRSDLIDMNNLNDRVMWGAANRYLSGSGGTPTEKDNKQRSPRSVSLTKTKFVELPTSNSVSVTPQSPSKEAFLHQYALNLDGLSGSGSATPIYSGRLVGGFNFPADGTPVGTPLAQSASVSPRMATMEDETQTATTVVNTEVGSKSASEKDSDQTKAGDPVSSRQEVSASSDSDGKSTASIEGSQGDQSDSILREKTSTAEVSETVRAPDDTTGTTANPAAATAEAKVSTASATTDDTEKSTAATGVAALPEPEKTHSVDAKASAGAASTTKDSITKTVEIAETSADSKTLTDVVESLSTDNNAEDEEPHYDSMTGATTHTLAHAPTAANASLPDASPLEQISGVSADSDQLNSEKAGEISAESGQDVHIEAGPVVAKLSLKQNKLSGSRQVLTSSEDAPTLEELHLELQALDVKEDNSLTYRSGLDSSRSGLDTTRSILSSRQVAGIDSSRTSDATNQSAIREPDPNFQVRDGNGEGAPAPKRPASAGVQEVLVSKSVRPSSAALHRVGRPSSAAPQNAEQSSLRVPSRFDRPASAAARIGRLHWEQPRPSSHNTGFASFPSRSRRPSSAAGQKSEAKNSNSSDLNLLTFSSSSPLQRSDMKSTVDGSSKKTRMKVKGKNLLFVGSPHKQVRGLGKSQSLQELEKSNVINSRPNSAQRVRKGLVLSHIPSQLERERPPSASNSSRIKNLVVHSKIESTPNAQRPKSAMRKKANLAAYTAPRPNVKPAFAKGGFVFTASGVQAKRQ